MSNLIPATWKDSAEHLRGNVVDAFSHLGRRGWWPSIFRRERDQELSFWPNTLFFQGGPAIDVTEDADTVHVSAELPGLDEKDFSVEVLDDRLVLRGEKKATREEKNRDYHISECSYGSFTRMIPLPCEVDTNRASAHYTKGILTVTLPKTSQAKARKVKVDVA